MRLSNPLLASLLTLAIAVPVSLGCGGGGSSAPPSVVVPPAITADPANQTVVEGAQATFAVTAIGTAPLTYQWLKGGTALAGASSATYLTPKAVLADNGATFSVVVSNASGQQATSRSATLTVQALQSVPAVPAGVTVQGGNGKATLAWSASLGATSYNVYYGTTSGAARVSGTKVAGAVSPQDLAGLTNGIAYYFVVTAVNALGESLPSLEVAATPAATAPPAAPAGVTATAGNGQVTLGWNAVANATAYNLYWALAAGVTKGTATAVLGVHAPYAHLGLTNGTPYYYRVTAVNAYGESPVSLEVTATPAVSNGAGTTQLLGSYPTVSGHYGALVTVVGNTAYFSERNFSGTDTFVRMLNLATPSAPALIGSYPVGGVVTSSRVLNGYLYLGLHNVLYEFQTVSLANPAAPVLVAKNVNVAPFDLAISGSNLFTVGPFAGDSDYISRDINVFSLANPAAPARIGSFYQFDSTGTSIWADSSKIAIQNGYAYVAASSRGLVILNVNNPAAPIFSGNYNSSVPNGYNNVSVSGTLACVMNMNYGIEILDASNPAAVRSVGVYNSTAPVMDFTFDGKYLYVAESTNGLKIIDISVPSMPVVAGSYNPTGTSLAINSVCVVGQTIYLADTNRGLLIVKFTP